MGILYSIISLLTLIIGAGIVVLLQMKKDYKTLSDTLKEKVDYLDKWHNTLLQDMTIISSENVNMLDLYGGMRRQMEKDSYASLTELSNRITSVYDKMDVYQQGNKTLFDTADSEFRRISQELMAIKNNLKRFNDDPNLKARY